MSNIENIMFFLYGDTSKSKEKRQNDEKCSGGCHCNGNCQCNGNCHEEETPIACGYEAECENDYEACLECPCNGCEEDCADCEINPELFNKNEIDDAGEQLLQRLDSLGLLKKSKALNNNKESKKATLKDSEQKFTGKTVIELFEIGEEDLANNIIACWTSKDINDNNIRIEALRFGDPRLMYWNFDGKEVIASLADFTALLMTRA